MEKLACSDSLVEKLDDKESLKSWKHFELEETSQSMTPGDNFQHSRSSEEMLHAGVKQREEALSDTTKYQTTE